ncbi:hypothetical protein EGW08_012734 [Elysia chlorotica]|uniref:Uncharacterized protein n=1 Tax=Elysia chlorotica TaxID=188477 RepID=A0A433TD22_ELYCH|nr:hypothetical protein EGW08_012734 [Elysia chlorotica]
MNIGRLATSRASEPGRPMTRAEGDRAVERAVKDPCTPGINDGNKSKLDWKYFWVGIGKRDFSHAFTLRENPNRSAMTVYKSKQQTRPSAEKVLLPYPNTDSRKLPLSKILIPSRTEEAPPKTTISERDRRRVGRGSGNGAKRRTPEYKDPRLNPLFKDGRSHDFMGQVYRLPQAVSNLLALRDVEINFVSVTSRRRPSNSTSVMAAGLAAMSTERAGPTNQHSL